MTQLQIGYFPRDYWMDAYWANDYWTDAPKVKRIKQHDEALMLQYLQWTRLQQITPEYEITEL